MLRSLHLYENRNATKEPSGQENGSKDEEIIMNKPTNVVLEARDFHHPAWNSFSTLQKGCSMHWISTLSFSLFGHRTYVGFESY